jgi:hypothetical protein
LCSVFQDPPLSSSTQVACDQEKVRLYSYPWEQKANCIIYYLWQSKVSCTLWDDTACIDWKYCIYLKKTTLKGAQVWDFFMSLNPIWEATLRAVKITFGPIFAILLATILVSVCAEYADNDFFLFEWGQNKSSFRLP